MSESTNRFLIGANSFKQKHGVKLLLIISIDNNKSANNRFEKIRDTQLTSKKSISFKCCDDKIFKYKTFKINSSYCCLLLLSYYLHFIKQESAIKNYCSQMNANKLRFLSTLNVTSFCT